MVKFGDLSQEEKQAFVEAVKKNAEQSTEVRVVWPDDDEELMKWYTHSTTALGTKSREQILKEINEALRGDIPEMTMEEEAEYAAEFGYLPDWDEDD